MSKDVTEVEEAGEPISVIVERIDANVATLLKAQEKPAPTPQAGGPYGHEEMGANARVYSAFGDTVCTCYAPASGKTGFSPKQVAEAICDMLNGKR